MKVLKISTIAAALLASTAMATVPALSQDAGTTEPQKRILPQGGQEEGSMEGDGSSGAAVEQGQDDSGTSAGADVETTEPSDQSAKDEAPGQEVQSGEVDSATEAAPGQMQNSGEVDSATEAAPGQTKQDDQAATEEPSGETTASIDISEEQRTEIRNVIVETEVEPVEVDFDVEVGVSVPETIELHPLPPRIVEIVPEYEGYQYFVLENGQIVIVDPDSHEVVVVIVA